MMIEKNTQPLVELQQTCMRFRQPKDRLYVKPLGDGQYLVTNTGHMRPTENVVTLMLSKSGKRIGSCTCPDFANYSFHRMACKHIRSAAGIHPDFQHERNVA
jgi:hypothetical protein